MKIGRYAVHPAALAWPDISAADQRELAESIRKSGQKDPIKLLRGEVVDGRCRLRACLAIGVEPVFARLPDDTDPWDYSLTVNWHRRHLLKSQFAAIAAECVLNSKAWADECAQAEAAQIATQKRKDERSRVGATIAPTAKPVGKASDRLAKKVGVSTRTAQDLITVREKSPEKYEDVKAGKVSASKAAEQVRNPKPAVAPVPGLPTADAIGREIPLHLRDAWHRMQVLCASFEGVWRDIGKEWRNAKGAIEQFNETAQVPAIERYLKDVEGALAGPLRQATYAIRSAAPFAVCWKCDGEGCNSCQKTGLYAVASKENVERELGKKGAA